MKIFKIIVWLVFLSLNSIYAQEKVQKVKIYRAWLHINNEPFKIDGVLSELKDSSILVTNLKYGGSQEIYVRNIEKIKIRRKNKVGKGALIGSASGLVVGIGMGFIAGDDDPGFLSTTAEEKAIWGGLVMMPIGAGIGALVGSSKQNFDINRSIDNYNNNKVQLKKYVYVSKQY